VILGVGRKGIARALPKKSREGNGDERITITE
jgi:hypothetical protein